MLGKQLGKQERDDMEGVDMKCIKDLGKKETVKEVYQIIAPVGKGSYGAVLKAYNRSKKKTVAIKICDMSEDVGCGVTTLREVVLMQELDHINITR